MRGWQSCVSSRTSFKLNNSIPPTLLEQNFKNQKFALTDIKTCNQAFMYEEEYRAYQFIDKFLTMHCIRDAHAQPLKDKAILSAIIVCRGITYARK